MNVPFLSFLFVRVPALAAAVLALAPGPAAALGEDDRLVLFAAQSIGNDDNVFRLADGVDPLPILGSSARGDRYLTTSVGADFDIPVSAQRFVGNVTLNRERYDRFANLDLDAHSVDAAWLWQAGERFDGRVGYLNEEILGSFANLQGGIQSRTPNFIDIRRTVVEGGYQLAPRLELRGSLTERRHSNSAPEFQVSNARIDETGLTLSYVARSGNRLSLRYRSEDGRLPELQLVGGVLVDNSYDQHDVSMLTDWTITEQSRLNLRLGRVSRSYPQSAQRDFSDWVFSAEYAWQPVAEFSLTALTERDISASEEINVGFVFVERSVLRPAVQITDQIDLAGSLERSARKYLGDPGLQAIEGASVTERVRAVGLSVEWEPIRLLRLSLAWRRVRRDSTLSSFGDYDTEITSLEIRGTF